MMKANENENNVINPVALVKRYKYTLEWWRCDRSNQLSASAAKIIRAEQCVDLC